MIYQPSLYNTEEISALRIASATNKICGSRYMMTRKAANSTMRVLYSNLVNKSLMSLFAAHRGFKGGFNGPASLYSFGNKMLRFTNNLTPFHNGLSLPLIVKKNICATIAGLLFACYPPAVFFIIVPIVIPAIQRHALWLMAHIGKEILKFKPCLANFNSPSSIIRKVFHIWIAAALNHCIPNSVNWGLTKAMRSISQPHFKGLSTACLFSKATARANKLSFNILAACYNSSTAFAFAKPCRSAIWQPLEGKHREATAFLSQSIYYFFHGADYSYHYATLQGVNSNGRI